MRLVDIEPIVELVKKEHEKVQNRFNEANVFKEPNDVALWGAVLQEVGAFIGLMINAPTVDAVPVEWLQAHITTIEQQRLLDEWAERKEHETD